MTFQTVDDLTQRVLNWHDSLPWTKEFGLLLPPVLAELVGGEPVEPARIAARTGLPVDDVLGLPAPLPIRVGRGRPARRASASRCARPATASRSTDAPSTPGAHRTRSRSRPC